MATKTRWREHISHGPTGGLAETQAVVGLWGCSANKAVTYMETATPKFFDRRGLKTWSCNGCRLWQALLMHRAAHQGQRRAGVPSSLPFPLLCYAFRRSGPSLNLLQLPPKCFVHLAHEGAGPTAPCCTRQSAKRSKEAARLLLGHQDTKQKYSTAQH